MEKQSNSSKPESEQQLPDPSPSPDSNPKPDPKDEDETLNGGGNNIGSFVMGSESQSEAQIQSESSSANRLSSGGSKKSVHWSPKLVTESQFPHNHNNDMSGFDGSNPYLARSPAPVSSFSLKESVDTVKNVLERWGKRVGEATKKAENLAGNTWQHLRTSPSFAEAAMARIAQGTKVLAEGGYEKIFRQTFETVPDEQLLNSFACYLSTSAGPVMGVLYVSSAKLAFCSDNPLSYQSGTQTEWSYYKVVIPLHQLKSVNPSSSRANPSEKYIQVISVDNHEFWFMGFLYYDSAVECLEEALEARNLQTV